MKKKIEHWKVVTLLLIIYPKLFTEQYLKR